MKNLEFKEIEAIVRKQSSKRKEDESLLTILLQCVPYQSFNGLWFLINVVLIIGIVISWITDSRLLGFLIVFLILSNGIFYENRRKWNNKRLEKSLVENFNTSPKYFENALQHLSELEQKYETKKEELQHKISTSGLMPWGDRMYYEKELIPHWDRIIWSIQSDIEWCKTKKIDAMRRRDGIGQVIEVKSYYASHNDVV